MRPDLKIVLLGPPGAGKGTQAVTLANRLNVPKISTGDIFRDAIQSQSKLGKTVASFIDNGLLVPDTIVFEVVKGRLSKEDCINGFILDGFPRTLRQAKDLENSNIIVNLVIFLRVDEQIILKRILGRQNCPNCHRMFHVDLNPPKRTDICDDCGICLTTRKDDDRATILRRLEVYLHDTAPLIQHYQENASVHFLQINSTVDQNENPEQISSRIISILHTSKMYDSH